jgi:hypothetical protein
VLKECCAFLLFSGQVYLKKFHFSIWKDSIVKNDGNLGEEGNKMLAEWIGVRKDLEGRKQQLSGEDLSNLKLMEAELDNAKLTEADLSTSYLIRADLSGADLSGADLSSAVLAEANLTGANFSEAELMDTWLNGADLSGAVNLTCDQIEEANIDQDTKLPDYIKITWNDNGTFDCSC